MSDITNPNDVKNLSETIDFSELSFEEALDRLDKLVLRMQARDLSLEESMDLFQEGTKLVKHSRDKLEQAEQKVSVLLKNAQGEVEEQDFLEDEDAK